MRVLVFALALLACGMGSAQADTFVWQDPKGDFTMSFPDTWRVQTPDTPSTMLLVAGPVAPDKEHCRMMVQRDGRANIYPKRLLDEAVDDYLTEDFYRGQIGQYDDAQITVYYPSTSLGDKGDATAARYVYNDNGTPMYGMMMGSLYGGNRYVVSCAADSRKYERWAGLFASIIGSVQLKDKYHPFAIGYYRDFLADPKLVLQRLVTGLQAMQADPSLAFPDVRSLCEGTTLDVATFSPTFYDLILDRPKGPRIANLVAQMGLARAIDLLKPSST